MEELHKFNNEDIEIVEDFVDLGSVNTIILEL